MPVIYDDVGEPRPPKKRRPEEETYTAPQVSQNIAVLTSGGGNDYYTQLALAEEAGSGILPTSTVNALASAGLEDGDVWKAASVFAQLTDISPRWLLPNRDDYSFGDLADPITGNPLSFSQARAAFKVYEPLYVYELLKSAGAVSADVWLMLQRERLQVAPEDAERVTEAERSRGEMMVPTPEGKSVDAEVLADVFEALSIVSGDELKFQDALAVGFDLAATELNLDIFKQNLAMIERAQGVFGTEGVIGAEYTPLRAVAIARELTERGVTLAEPKDLLMLDPTVSGLQAQVDKVEAQLRNYFGDAYVEKAIANPDSQEGLFYFRERNAELTRMGWTAGTELVFEGILDAVENTETNYIEAGDKIAQEYRIHQDRANIANSVLGRWAKTLILEPIEYVYNATLGAAERVVLDPAVWGMTPRGEFYGLTPDTQGITNVEQIQSEALHDALADARDYLRGTGNSFEDLQAEGVPLWFTFAADFALGFKFGPDVLALKAWASRTRDARLVGDASAWTKWVDHSFRFRSLGGKRGYTVPEAIVEAAERGDTKWLMGISDDLTGYFGNGLDHVVSSEAYTFARAGLLGGRAKADIVGDLRETFLYAANATTDNAFSARLNDLYATLRARSDATLNTHLSMGHYDVALQQVDALSHEAGRALGAMDDLAALGWREGGTFGLEIPHLRNPVSRMLGGLGRSQLADTGFARTVDAALEASPARAANRLVLDLEDVNLVRDAESVLVRSRVWSTSERAELLTELGTLSARSNPARERQFAQWIDNVNTTQVSRVSRQYGLDDDQAKVVQRLLDARFGRAADRQQVYGVWHHWDEVTKEFIEVPVREPYLATQLLNTANIFDPVALRHGIGEAVGYFRQARSVVLRTLKATLPEAKFAKAIRGVTFRRAINATWEAVVHDLFLGIWKPLVVIRPAYILRVVGLEEQGRFLSTLGAARRLEASRLAGRLVDPLGQRFFRVTAPRMGKTVEELETLYAAAVRGGEVKAVVTDLGNDLVQVDIPLPAPGRLPRATEAESQATRFALTGQEGPLHSAIERHYGAGWEAIGRDHPEFVSWWHRDLMMQFRQDEVGLLHLETVRLGMDEEESVAYIMGKLRSTEYRQTTARLMGSRDYTMSAVETQVRRGQSIVTSYTAQRQPEIAEAVLNGTLSAEFLQALPADIKPLLVHGAELEMALGRIGPAKRAMDGLGNLILRMPTNAFSRSPYANAWKDRMLRLMLGASDNVTPDALRKMEAAAEKFAKLQVNRIMFDYTRSGRFAEATAWVFPFFQPYAEAFLVWGRIIRQNPAVLAYARHIIDRADESPLVQTNEFGERVVPLTNWLFGARLLQTFTGAPGWRLSAPLESFNLFFQSAMPIPTGPILGDFSVPLPSLNLPLLGVLQTALNSDVVTDNLDPDIRSRLLSWAMEYGSVSAMSVLPTYARHFMTALAPQWFQNETRLQQDNALRLLAWQGLTPERLANDTRFAMEQTGRTFTYVDENGVSQPDLEAANAYLAEEARSTSEKVSWWRGLASMFFPAAPRVTWPHSEWLSELQTIREQYPDDWDKVKETFLSRHPDAWQFLISNTTWNDEMVGNSPIPITPTEAITRFFSGKGAREFAEKYPEFAFFIIPHEIRDGEYDPGALWAQVRGGQRGILSPEEKLEEASVQAGWSAFFDYREAWTAWQEAHPDYGSGDDPYDTRKALYDTQVQGLENTNPIWREAYNTHEERAGIDPKVLATARMLAKDELFAQTDLGKALKTFLPLYDSMRNYLRSYGISNITNVAAEELGFSERWEKGLAYLSETYGEDWDRAYSTFFSGALLGVESRVDRYRANLTPAERREDERIWREWEDLRIAIGQEQNESQQSAMYQERRELASQMFRDYGTGLDNPLRRWWEAKDPREKQSYRDFLVGLPYFWLSEFDRRVILGEKTTLAVEKIWQEYGDRRNVISYKEDHDPDYSAGQNYEELDRWLAKQAKSNTVLAQQIENANDWTYMFFKVHPELVDEENNPGADEWRRLGRAALNIRRMLEKYDITGSDLRYDADIKVWYTSIYEALDEWVTKDLFDNPYFASQWEALNDDYDDPLLRVFMPEFYYPIG